MKQLLELKNAYLKILKFTEWASPEKEKESVNLESSVEITESKE